MNTFKFIKSNTNITSDSDKKWSEEDLDKETISANHNKNIGIIQSRKSDYESNSETEQNNTDEKNVKNLVISSVNTSIIDKPTRIKKTTNKKENELSEIKEQIKIINTNIEKILNILQK